LISKENVAYGFRRNALGVKPIGQIVSIVSLLWVLATEGVLVRPGHGFIDLTALSRNARARHCIFDRFGGNADGVDAFLHEG
jgi:hypothetical protein